MWDLIVSFPDHCLSFYFSALLYGSLFVLLAFCSWFVKCDVTTLMTSRHLTTSRRGVKTRSI